MEAPSPPRVSCLLPVYNGEVFLAEAVRSILDQSYRDFELVVVDDGSTDATPQILTEFARQDGRVRVIRQANGGIVAALNTGLAHCRGEFVARMDADDIALPDRFRLQVEHLDTHPGCMIVGGQAKSLRPDGSIESRTTGGRHRRTDLSCFPPRIAVAMHPLIMMRRAAVQAIGGYRGDFPHAEDYDLFIRISRLGSVDNPPADMLVYRRHEGAISLRHLELQERSAALAEAAAIGEAGSPDALSWLLEPYIRLRIWRRYCSVEPARARSMLPRIIADAFAASPRALASPRYWGLRLRILGAVARRLRVELRSPPKASFSPS